MFRLSSNSTILGILSFSILCTNVFALEANTTITTTTTSPEGIEKRVIVTTVPAPKEILPAPQGYVTCFTLKAGWYENVWVAEHNVCQYNNSPEGVVWVEGYWACTKYNNDDGQCTNWDWKVAHWEKTLKVY